MFKNYFKVALRSLWKSKGFSAINIFGLAIGFAASLLVALYINDELSVDKGGDGKSSKEFEKRVTGYPTLPI